MIFKFLYSKIENLQACDTRIIIRNRFINKHTVEQSLLGMIVLPLQSMSFSSTGFDVVCVGQGISVVISG